MAALDGVNENRLDHRLMIALMVMTVVTGFIDAVSYLGLGRVFTANMTGNVVLLGFAVAGAPHLSMARSVTSLGAFLGGAVVGGRFGILGAILLRFGLAVPLLVSGAFVLAATVAYSTVSTPTNTATPAREPVNLPTEGARS